MHTIHELFEPELAEYAAKLQTAGFTIYGHNTPRLRYDDTPLPAGYFVYSRTVDGVELFGIVNRADFPLLGQPFSHSMPIRPSREHGSSMFVDPDPAEPLAHDSVEMAERVTRAENSNYVVGLHRNFYEVPRYLSPLPVETQEV
jgi:hypothetical protein